jgi:hypothetical protein
MTGAGIKGFWAFPGAEELLKQRDAEGVSASRIAEELSAKYRLTVTRNAVIGKLTRLGLHKTDGEKPKPRPKRTPPEVRKPPPPKLVMAVGKEADAARVEQAKIGKALIEKVEAAPPTGGKKLLKLRADDCRFILGAVGGPDVTRYCGQPTGGATYCSVHRAISYVAPTSRRA